MEQDVCLDCGAARLPFGGDWKPAVSSIVLLVLSSTCGPLPEPAEDQEPSAEASGALTSTSWSSPRRLDDGARNADHPTVALDPGGNAIAAWRQQVNYPAKIFVSRYDVGTQAWRTPQLLESGGRVIEGPHLAMNSGGEAFVIWEQRVTDPDRIFVSHYLPGSDRWTEPESLNRGFDRARDPHIAIDDAGNAIALFWANPSLAKPASLYARRYSASTASWDAAQEIDNLTTNAQEPAIAMNSGGDATVVWTQGMAGGAYVFASQYRAADNAWSVPQPISNPHVQAPRVGRDEHGRSMALWQQDCGDLLAVEARMFCLHFSRSTPEGGWTAPELIPGSEGPWGGESERLTPDLAINAYGSAMLVWTQRKTKHRPFSIWASRFSAFTERWSVGPTLLERTHQDAREPQVVIDAQSNATAVWHQLEDVVVQGASQSVFSVLKNEYTFADRGWAYAAQPVELSSSQAMRPGVARNPSGQTVVVWSQMVDDHFAVFVSQAGY